MSFDPKVLLAVEHDDAPIVNVAVEDALAHAPDEAGRTRILEEMILLCFEMLARQEGRQRARDYAASIDRFLVVADPVRPWEP